METFADIPVLHSKFAAYHIFPDTNFDCNLPSKQKRLVLAWVELHHDELMADWNLLMNGEEPFKIQPLQ